MPFEITAARSPGNVPKAPERFPRPLDIQVNGVSLGPGITALNFTGVGWTITVGTGENADTVTIALT